MAGMYQGNWRLLWGDNWSFIDEKLKKCFCEEFLEMSEWKILGDLWEDFFLDFEGVEVIFWIKFNKKIDSKVCNVQKYIVWDFVTKSVWYDSKNFRIYSNVFKKQQKHF